VLALHHHDHAARVRIRWRPRHGWVVLADPEGSQLCNLRSEQEYAAHV
jgi:hypothetical protein